MFRIIIEGNVFNMVDMIFLKSISADKSNETQRINGHRYLCAPGERVFGKEVEGLRPQRINALSNPHRAFHQKTWEGRKDICTDVQTDVTDCPMRIS